MIYYIAKNGTGSNTTQTVFATDTNPPRNADDFNGDR